MLPYHPALRFKQGEYSAGAKIARDIQRHVHPRFIIPPPTESDPEKGGPPTADEIARFTGERIGKHWPLNPAFLDAQFVAPLLGNDVSRGFLVLPKAEITSSLPWRQPRTYSIRSFADSSAHRGRDLESTSPMNA